MVEDAKGGEGAWDLKQAPGGLVDIEFIAQALLLVNAHRCPALISTETEAVLSAAAEAALAVDGRCRYPAAGAEALSGADPDHPPLPRSARSIPQRRRALSWSDWRGPASFPISPRSTPMCAPPKTAVRAIFERLIGTVLEIPSS